MDGAPIQSTGVVKAETPSLEDELMDELFTEVFPEGLPRPQPVASSAILSSFPLEVSHLQILAAHADSGQTLNDNGGGVQRLKSIRHTHHKLAQLLAAGMDETRAAYLCNYTPSTVSILKSDPGFAELLAYYGAQKIEEWKDAVGLMADLHIDVLQEIRERLEENPGAFNAEQLTKLHVSLADRSGNGPTSNVNANVTTVSLTAEDLRRAKQDAGRGADRQVRPLTEEDRRALVGQVDHASLELDVIDLGGEQWREESGKGLRGEGAGEAEGNVANAGASPVD